MAKKDRQKKTGFKPVKPIGLALKYQVAASLFLLIAGICVLYPELVFQNKVIVAGDVEAAASFATPIKKAMQEGEADPLWNPYLFSGMPSYGSLSYLPGVYPVGLLTGFLSGKLGFPNFTWLLFHVFLLGVGMWLVLMDRGVHFMVAAGAGILMMWMPNHVAVGVHGHGSQACAVAYIPFVLLFWDRLWRGKGVLLNSSILVILLGFSLLRGHLQITYYTFAVMGAHFLFFAVLKIKDGWTGKFTEDELTFKLLRSFHARGASRSAALLDVAAAAAVLVIVVVGAMLISSVVFLPVQDFAKHSIRGASEAGGLDYDYATSWSLHPKEALTFIVPFSSGFGKAYYFGQMPFTDYPNYLGIVTVFFAVLGVVLVRARFVYFLVFLVVLTTVVAFGRHLPILYNPLFHLMPYFDKFRIPVMVLIVQQIAVVLLFGIGVQAVFHLVSDKARRRSGIALLSATAVLLVILFSYSYWTNTFPQSVAPKLRFVGSAAQQLRFANDLGGFLFGDLVKLSLLLVATTASLFLLLRRVMPPTVFVVVILVLALVDIFMIDRYIIHPEKLFTYERGSLIMDKSERDRFLEPDPVVNYLTAQEGLFRVFPMNHPSMATRGDFRTNRYMNFAISSIGGYHPAKLSIYEEFLRALGPALQRGNFQPINMLNVRYVISATELPENAILKPRWDGLNYRGEHKFVYENVHALPRVFFVDTYEVRPGREALDYYMTQGVNLGEVALLDRNPAVRPESDSGAKADITSYGYNEIRIDAQLPYAALMVLSEIYYPRWGVEIDGQPGDILRANHILRAVSLPAGDHEIVFRYDDSLLKRARAISRVTMIVALLIMAVTFLLQMKERRWKLSS